MSRFHPVKDCLLRNSRLMTVSILCLGMASVAGCAPQQPSQPPISLLPYPQSIETQVGQTTVRPTVSDIELPDAGANGKATNLTHKRNKKTVLKSGGPLASVHSKKAKSAASAPVEGAASSAAASGTAAAASAPVETGSLAPLSIPERSAAAGVTAVAAASAAASPPPVPAAPTLLAHREGCPVELAKKAQEDADAAKGIGDLLSWSKTYQLCLSSSQDPLLKFVPYTLVKGWSTQEVRLLNVDAAFSDFVVNTLTVSSETEALAGLVSILRTEGCGPLNAEICERIRTVSEQRIAHP